MPRVILENGLVGIILVAVDLGEYVRGDVHTNTPEDAWGLFKRSLIGAYHQVSVKHLDAYLDEFEYRWNTRKTPFMFRHAPKVLVQAEHLEHQELVAPKESGV